MDEDSRRNIREANRKAYHDFRDGICIVCGKKTAAPFDLCEKCQDEPIADYNAFHIGQLFGLWFKVELMEMDQDMCRAYDEGYPAEALQRLRDFCYSYGTPGRLYYCDRLEKAKRASNLNPGSPAGIMKEWG